MISERLGNLVRGRLLTVGAFLAGLGLTPNMLTIIGVVLNVVVAVIIATGTSGVGRGLAAVRERVRHVRWRGGQGNRPVIGFRRLSGLHARSLFRGGCLRWRPAFTCSIRPMRRPAPS